MRRLRNILGGTVLGFMAIWFIGLGIKHSRSAERDRQRVVDVQILEAAFERYRAAHGKYPSPYGDDGIWVLSKDLVDGGFLPVVPDDPLWAGTDRQYHYVSMDGQRYGLLVHFELKHGAVPAGGACLAGVGTAGTGWWGQPPDFPF